MIEMKDCKLLFDSGTLTKAYVAPNHMGKGYIVLFDYVSKGLVSDRRRILRSQRSEEAKAFKRLESAVNAVKAIGFNSVTIIDLHS